MTTFQDGTWHLVGIGGAGDDFLMLLVGVGIKTVADLLTDKEKASALAGHMRALRSRLRVNEAAGWRLGQEALVLECCEVLREQHGEAFKPLTDHITVSRIRPHRYDFSAVEFCSLVITIPDVGTQQTHVFLGATEDLEVTFLRSVPGLPEAAVDLLRDEIEDD